MGKRHVGPLPRLQEVSTVVSERERVKRPLSVCIVFLCLWVLAPQTSPLPEGPGDSSDELRRIVSWAP